jgi:hypothetical protein
MEYNYIKLSTVKLKTIIYISLILVEQGKDLHLKCNMIFSHISHISFQESIISCLSIPSYHE